MRKSRSPHSAKTGTYRRAREAALQALYQWHMAALPVEQIKQQFVEDAHYQGIDEQLFARLLDGVVAHHQTLDEGLHNWLDRPLERIGPVEIAILRIAAYELCYCQTVPVRVVINEAINLAHVFGAEQSYRYINGVVDSAAHAWRGQTDESLKSRLPP